MAKWLSPFLFLFVATFLYSFLTLLLAALVRIRAAVGCLMAAQPFVASAAAAAATCACAAMRQVRVFFRVYGENVSMVL